MTMSSSHRPGEITTDKANHWIIILMDQQTAAHIKKIMDLTPLALPAANTTSAGSNSVAGACQRTGVSASAALLIPFKVKHLKLV